MHTMKTILITGGTGFVSRYMAEYYTAQGNMVYVLNRNTKPQAEGVHLLEYDRHQLGTALKDISFDAVIDATAYDAQDIIDLTAALGSFDHYIMISSSAVYPEYGKQPFTEDSPTAENKFWGKYGIDKIQAERALLQSVPDAYILRPPYLYGAWNNVYREAFVFECAIKDRPFYLPGDGSMNLQFFHVKDLCRFADFILEKVPDCHIFNVGNREVVSVKDWVSACYNTVGRKPRYIHVPEEIEQRNYFSFYRYDYYLDVSKMISCLSVTMSLDEGLKDAFAWYLENSDKVRTKPFIQYIDEHFKGRF